MTNKLIEYSFRVVMICLMVMAIMAVVITVKILWLIITY